MADGTSVTIEGMPKFRRELKQVDKTLLKELNKIGKDAAEIVATTARTIVPVLSGRLEASIKAGATAKAAYVKAGGVPYANPIHFGWAKHNIAPQPFLYEALDDRRDEVIEKFTQGLQDFIAKNFPGGLE